MFLESFESLAPLDRADSFWNRQIFETYQVDPFCCSTYWQFSCYQAFQPDRRLMLRQNDQSLLAFIEFTDTLGRAYLTPLDLGWKFGSPLLGQGAVDLFQEVLVEIEDYYYPAFPGIVISGIASNSDFAAQLLHSTQTAFNLYLNDRGTQCSADLSGGYTGYLSRRSRNHRRSLKKQAKRARQKQIVFERHSPVNDEQATGIFARMLNIESRSWKGIEQCGMTESPSTEYYDLMIKRLARDNNVRIIIARHDEQDIGYIFGGILNGIYRGQQFSFDNAWKKESIGNLLQKEKIQWLCEEGISRYDMGPMMEYKQHWTEQQVDFETWVLIKK